jgi:hypothetical protein
LTSVDADLPPGRTFSGFARDEPVDLLAPGSRFENPCLHIPPIEPDGAVPVGVENWEFFDGTLLAVGFREPNDVLRIEGTAVMIGVGLAITAKHVYDDLLDALLAGDEVMYCLGLRPGGKVDIWHVQHIKHGNTDGDLAILSLALMSDPPDDRCFNCLPLTARGEQLTIVGFSFDQNQDLLDDATGAISAVGQIFVAKGEVETFFWPRRPDGVVPFPGFHILCGSYGGMSGGAVLDNDGNVVGVISKGYNFEDKTIGAWCVDVFGWHVTASWPRNFYAPNTPIAAIPWIRIRDREDLTINDDGTIQITVRVD